VNAGTKSLDGMKDRLKLYEQRKPFRQKPGVEIIALGRAQTLRLFGQRFIAPNKFRVHNSRASLVASSVSKKILKKHWKFFLIG